MCPLANDHQCPPHASCFGTLPGHPAVATAMISPKYSHLCVARTCTRTRTHTATRHDSASSRPRRHLQGNDKQRQVRRVTHVTPPRSRTPTIHPLTRSTALFRTAPHRTAPHPAPCPPAHRHPATTCLSTTDCSSTCLLVHVVPTRSPCSSHCLHHARSFARITFSRSCRRQTQYSSVQWGELETTSVSTTRH